MIDEFYFLILRVSFFFEFTMLLFFNELIKANKVKLKNKQKS